MLDRAGEIQNDLAHLGPEVKNLRFELSGCRLECSGWNKRESRVIAEFCRRWQVEDGPIITTILHLGDVNQKPSTATVLTPSDPEALDDVDIRLDGASEILGSIAAKSIAVSLSDEAFADGVKLEGDSVLVHALGNCRVNLAGVKSRQVLFMLEGNATVEVLDMDAQLILVRQSGEGCLRILNTRSNINDGKSVFALVGNAERASVSSPILRVPESAVQAFWDRLAPPRA